MSQTQDASSRTEATAHNAVEMGDLTAPVADTTLPQKPAEAIPAQSRAEQEEEEEEETAKSPSANSPQAPPEPQVMAQPVASASEPEPFTMPQPALTTRQETEAIGPSTDLPTPMPLAGDAAHAEKHVIVINLLLTSTGTRHPYKIDERYLSRRNVTAVGADGSFDPFVISVYTLKELIWQDWREGTNGPVVYNNVSFFANLFNQSGTRDQHHHMPSALSTSVVFWKISSF